MKVRDIYYMYLPKTAIVPLADSCPCMFLAVHSYTPELAKDMLNKRKLPMLLILENPLIR